MLQEIVQEKIHERIIEILNESGLTVRRFAISCSIDPSAFDKKTKKKLSWTVNDVNKICDTFRIRKGWLIDGVGQKHKAPDEILDKIPATSGNVTNGIPLIPTNAMAGSLSGNDVQIMPYDIESYYVVPAFAKSDFCIRVEGNSMEPRYQRGDIIACKYVPMTDIFFQWGKVYVVATDQGVLVKHIKQGSDKEHVLLVSDNPDYDPFEIPTSCIYSVATINGLIRVE